MAKRAQSRRNRDDGLTNDQEAALGLDPTDADTDDDRLYDGDEVNKWGTDPRMADTDCDGLYDGGEILRAPTPRTRRVRDSAPTGRFCVDRPAAHGGGTVNRITALMVGTAVASMLPIATSQSVHAGGAVTAFKVATTVMIDDGTDTCSTSTHAVSHNGSDTVRYCVTLTNTGSEALSLHDVQGDSIGQLVGPADATVVEPGSSWSVTTTALETEPHLEQVEWAATGVDSGVEVVEQASAYVYIQLQGAFAVQLDMTAIADDGTDTCGTATDLAVPAGTPVRFCYTMTNTRAVGVAVTFLFDEHVGLVPGAADSGGVPLPELEPGESRVVTNVAVVDESGTWTGHWAGIEDVSDSIVQGTDGVAIEVVESPTTTTAPCFATTLPPPTDPPTTTQPSTTTTTAPTTTTTTLPPHDDHDHACPPRRRPRRRARSSWR